MDLDNFVECLGLTMSSFNNPLLLLRPNDHQHPTAIRRLQRPELHAGVRYCLRLKSARICRGHIHSVARSCWCILQWTKVSVQPVSRIVPRKPGLDGPWSGLATITWCFDRVHHGLSKPPTSQSKKGTPTYGL